MNLSERPFSKEIAEFNFLLDVSENADAFESVDPPIDVFALLAVEEEAAALGHDHEAKHLASLVLDVGLLYSGILDDQTLLLLVLCSFRGVGLDQPISDQDIILFFQAHGLGSQRSPVAYGGRPTRRTLTPR